MLAVPGVLARVRLGLLSSAGACDSKVDMVLTSAEPGPLTGCPGAGWSLERTPPWPRLRPGTARSPSSP